MNTAPPETISDEQIMEIAGEWFHTGENQRRHDGYYYRSLGTPSNVRGSDLIAFARALLAARPEVQPGKQVGFVSLNHYSPGNHLFASFYEARNIDHDWKPVYLSAEAS